MNKVFRIIWSSVKEKWIVVSEKASAKGCPIFTVGALSFGALLATLSPAYALDPGALPTGGQITAGQATIATSGTQMTINQASRQLIADWSTFNIGQDAGVRFNQPGTSSTALNRIADASPTRIMGSLSANGNVMLVNPSGILFGKTARVDVGGLVASSLNILDSDYLDGKYRFVNSGKAGDVINQGAISAGKGGVVALIAPKVINEGTISSVSGSVALVAGNQVSLDFRGDGLISYTVEQGAVDALAENSGLIKADGGMVVMTAKAADLLTQSVVNNTGVIEAKSLQQQGGRIILDADDGQTTVSGTLDASSTDSKGGTVIATGTRVLVADDAHLNASGATGGGEVLVGGDWQGSGDLPHASAVVMSNTAVIDASATVQGDGGKVVLWSDDYTGFYGTIKATGGVLSGDGGHVETSSKNNLQAFGGVNTDAPNGQVGNWLLDPYNVSITTSSSGGSFVGTNPFVWTPTATSSKVSNATILSNLGTANVTISTGTVGDGGGDPGNITIDAPIAYTSSTARTLTLNALGTISGTGNLGSSTGALSLVFNVGSGSGTYSGLIAGAGTVTKQGAGTLTLSNTASTYTGKTFIQAGTLAVMKLANRSSTSSLGAPTTTANGTIDIGSGSTSATLQFVGTAISSTNRAINLAGTTGGATLDASGTATLTISGGLSSTVAGAKTLTITGSNTGTNILSGVIANGSGTTSLIKAGAGTWRLSATTSTYTGTTSIQEGVLSVMSLANGGSSSSLGSASSAIAIGSGTTSATLSYVGTSARSTNRVIDMAGTTGGATLDASGTAAITFAGNVTASGAGAKTLTLTGTYNGTNTVSGVIMDSSGGATSLIKAGTAYWTLSGNNTFTGGTSIITGGRLTLGSGLALQYSTLTPPSTSSWFTFGTQTAATIGGLNGSNGLALTNASSTSVALTVGGGNTTSSYSGVLSGGGSLTKTGSGTLTLSGGNSYTGATTIDGGTLEVGGSGTLAGGSYAGAITLSNSASFVYGSSANQTLSGLISGTGSLTMSGSGTLTLSNPSSNNSYTGPTTINSGTLALGVSGQIDNNTSVIINGGTFAVGSYQESVGYLTLSAGSITGNAGTGWLKTNSASFIVNNASDVSISANLDTSSSSYGLTKSGTGKLTLSGSNLYKGVTTIDEGTLQLGAAGVGTNTPLGTADGATTVSAGAVLDLNGFTLSTAEALTLNGSGILGNGALINSSSTGAGYSGAITLGSASSIVSTVGAITLSNTVDGAYDLAVNGSGAVTFSAAIGSGTALNSFTSDASTPLYINGGSVRTSNDQTYAGSTTFGTATTLTSTGNGNITATGTVTATAGKVTFVAGSGDVTFDTITNNFSTVEVTSAGAVRIVDSNAMTVSGISSSGTVDISTRTGDLTLSGNISTSDTSDLAVVLNSGSSSSAGTASGGNIIFSGTPTISTGTNGRVTLFTGSVSGGSAYLVTLAGGNGSGHFRYGSDETYAGYTAALGSGTYVIYREQPTITVTADNQSVTYGTAPTLTYTVGGDLKNGDLPTLALSGITYTVGGLTSTSGNYTAGSHSITPSGGTSGGKTQLGYSISSYTAGTLTVGQLALTGTSIGNVSKTYGDVVTVGTVTFGNVKSSGSSTDNVVATASLVSASYSTSNNLKAGSYTQTVGSITGTDSANYTFSAYTTTSANYTVGQLALTGTSDRKSVV